MKLTLPLFLRPNKTWIVLGVALGIGLLAALVARSYLSHQMEEMEARTKGKTVNVVVAKGDLPKGTPLSASNLAVRAIPAEYAHSVAVTPDQYERLNGRTLAFAIKGGEMVLWSLLEGQRAPTFSARVEAGRRAITLPVDEINSISGMLEPGDTIDLLVTVDQKGKKMILTLLQGVQVMATGQRSVDDPKSGERRQYSTVTLDTDPEEARSLIAARELGKVTALLRNPQDKPASRKGGIDLASWMGGREVPVAMNDKGVPVLYGGAKLSAEDTTLSPRGRRPLEADKADPADAPASAHAASSQASGRP